MPKLANPEPDAPRRGKGRLVWGIVATRHARFAQFIRHLRRGLDHLRHIASGREACDADHTPAGVALASRRHGENLVLAMLHGKKRKAGPHDVD